MHLRDMMYMSMFTAVIGVLGLIPPIPIPFIPVPITAQTLGVMLAGCVLGAKRGALSLLLFIALLCAGVPLLSGGRGGIGILFGISGGYILSWPIAAFIIGYLVERYWKSLTVWKLVLFNFIGGILFVNLSGSFYLSIITDTPWLAAATSTLVFIPGDLIKGFIAATLAYNLSRAYPLIRKQEAVGG